jgi:phosphoribosylformylglycinamidine synthase subunit PurS
MVPEKFYPSCVLLSFWKIMKAKIFVTLKNGILDPQGRAIQQSLHTLGFSTVEEVRIGKFMELDLNETDTTSAEKKVKTMCEKLLANTVIEDFHYEIFEK